MSRSNKNLLFLEISFQILMFGTLKAWPFLYVSETLLTLLMCVLMIGGVMLGNTQLNFTYKRVNAIVLLILAAILSTNGNLNAYIIAILRIFPFIIFLLLSYHIRLYLFENFKKVFSVVVVCSLSFWILHLFNIPLPNFYQSFGENYHFDNYFFFVDFIAPFYQFFPRFHCIFIEPGYFACLIVLILYQDQYDFKKKINIVYLIALFLTYSVAGLTLFTVGYISLLIKSKSKNKKWQIAILLVLSGAFLYFNNSKEPNVVNQMFGERMVFDESEGKLKGYNRTGERFEYFWKNNYPGDESILLGMGEKFDNVIGDESAVDLRAYLVKFGLLATLAYIIFLYYCYRKDKSYYGFWYFILFLMIIYRGYSMMYWLAFLITYVEGIRILAIKNKSNATPSNSPNPIQTSIVK